MELKKLNKDFSVCKVKDYFLLIAKSLKVLDITGFSAFTATNLLLFYYF